LIELTSSQLIKIGAHLGHSFLNSKFLSSWMLYGWRLDIFVFDTIYSLYLFRIGISFVKKCIINYRPIWFVNLNPYLAPVIARYTYGCGESFSIYRWVNGALTNFRSVIGWGTLLYRLAGKNIYNFSHHDRKDLSSLIGFIFNKKRLPGTLFLPSVKNCEIASDEFASANIPTIGVVDSNALSWAVTVPIPGNDDSFQCINFYCQLFAKIILAKKLRFLVQWDEEYSIRSLKLKRRLYLLYLINKYHYKLHNFDENLHLILNVLKNSKFFWKRSLTRYESIFKSFVQSDIIFKWKND